ncbi:hypothetical protein [Pseudomarimonas salicorniae]|uniref:Uncharacterized protein n=1 Tax=Pseudomarimonas salicorniae TaxID=2933270 RepID=A0ABT0GCB0_9GAMM|nr:hypothetical protein [Lysobacter sp. CAU 1642]MCK7592166.1 hypothetical protein [Lysobacter sp. CAU 1642]
MSAVRLPGYPLAVATGGCRLSALCACGPLGISGGDDSAPLQILAALLVDGVEHVGDRLRLVTRHGVPVELYAVPETDWLAWEVLCAGLAPMQTAPRREAVGRRLLSFRAGRGSLPEVRESEPRCGWTRRWLSGAASPGLSASATPTAPPAGW